MFRVEFWDEYNNLDETEEFDTIDEVEKAITNKVKNGHDFDLIKVFQAIDFVVEVKTTVTPK